jgi:phosphate transport system substrate-binding protein
MKFKFFVAAALALAALTAPASAGAVTLIGSGGTAPQPVLMALFATYTKQVNPKVHFVYSADGGNAGVKDVQTGVSQFAGQGIYRGLLTDWSQIPGSGISGTIDPVGRDSNGGTYNFFMQAVLDNEVAASNVNALTADGLVVNAVKQDPDAIGYAGLAWQSKSIKALRVNGIKCEAKNISVSPLKYPLSRYLYLVLPGNGKESPPALLKFIDWARTSKLAGEVISAAGGVPAFNKTK